VSSPLPRNRPVLNIDKGNFKNAVRKVVRDVRFRTDLAEMGRAFIDAGYSTPPAIAQYMLDAIERDRQGRCDLYPTLFTDRGTIPEGEPMPGYLPKRNLEILLRHGAHPDTDLRRLPAAGLLPADAGARLNQVPRWDVSRLKEAGPWVLMPEDIAYGSPRAVPVVE
jgi:hypothetical protein